LDGIYEDHYETLSIIRYHAWWPSSNDPYYLANIPENTARINYYGADYTPHLWIDGDIDGQWDPIIHQWESLITNDESVPSPLSIELMANYGLVGDYGTVTAVIVATDPIEYTNLKTRFAITESHLPPIGAFDEFNNVMRDMIPDAGGLDLTISEGDTVTVEQDYVLSNDWNFANLDIIAFVQSDAGHRVLQAARLTPPSGALTGQVTSSSSGFAIPNATVTIVNTTYGDSTDSQGNYVFSFLPGNQTIIAGAAGYDPDTLDVMIAAGDTTVFDVVLDPGATSSITGTVRDPEAGSGLLAHVTLYMNGDSLATVDTNPVTGAYTFSGISISMPPWVVYTDLRVVGSIPYPTVYHGETIVVEEGTPAIVDFELLPADVFLVDDDEGESYENYFRDEIETTGRTYYHFDVADAGEPAVNYLNLFPHSSSVIWFTGDATDNTISEAERDSLAKFLDLGGSVLLTGQNIAEDLDGSDFLNDYFHVSHGGNVSYWISHGLLGNPVTGYLEFFLTLGSGGANNQTSRDLLLPETPAEECIFYLLSPTDLTPQGTAAVYVEGQNDSKAVLIGFGLEALNRTGGDTTRATREEALLAILNWFDGIVDIGDGDGSGGILPLPRSLALNQNYPNPFNPSTTIRYAIPASRGNDNDSREAVPVRLTLYDLRGRLVKTLVDTEQVPGNYTVHWDGRDSTNRTIGSGIYLYRLTVEDQVMTRKMTVLR
jgi:hypothetical protein